MILILNQIKNLKWYLLWNKENITFFKSDGKQMLSKLIGITLFTKYIKLIILILYSQILNIIY